MDTHYIWTDKYAPKELDEIVSHDLNIQILENLIKKRNMPHVIFYGKSGIGKTSIISACITKIYKDTFRSCILELNASDDRGIEMIREKIKSFASTTNLFNNNVKLVILDEADLMTADAQTALKKIIELYIKNCRFCILCNNINKIIPEIQSRCMKMRFKPIKKPKALKRLKYICDQEQLSISENALNIIIDNSDHDLRKMINLLQSISEINSNKINVSNIYKFLNIINNKEEDLFKQSIKTDSLINIFNNIQKYIKIYNYSITDIIKLVYKFIREIKSIDKTQYDLLTNCIINLADLEFKISNGCEYYIASGYISSLLWDMKELL